jgi:hypothetical protein
MKESVNISHVFRHFGDAEAFHSQIFAANVQVEDSEVTHPFPCRRIISSVIKSSTKVRNQRSKHAAN